MLVQTYKIIKDIINMLSNGFVMIEQFSKSDNIHVWIGKTKTRFLMYGGELKPQRHNTNVETLLQPTISEH